MDNVGLTTYISASANTQDHYIFVDRGAHGGLCGVDKPNLTDNFLKNAEINWNALSTRCYLSRILPNKKPKYAAIANRRYRVIFDVVLTRSILKSKV